MSGHTRECEEALRAAADALNGAGALCVAAGAGIGVDSGLPDFRGPHGFWRAYPPYAEKGLEFTDLANPRWFHEDPAVAWGFYGHRLSLYRKTQPHRGFDVLLQWGRSMPSPCVVFTSNVDGQFQSAGFPEESVVEAHGSVHWLQPLRATGELIPADRFDVEVDERTMRAREPLPRHPERGDLLRPNVLMFGDSGWDSSRTETQLERFRDWTEKLEAGRLVVVECGAGTAVPTVRAQSERLVRANRGTLIRINTREPEVPGGHIGVPLGALEAILAIDARRSTVSS